MTLVKEIWATHPAWLLARFGDSPVDLFWEIDNLDDDSQVYNNDTAR